MSKKLSRVKSLPPEVVGKLRQHNVISCKDFLTTSTLELMGILNYTFAQLQTVTTLVSNAISPKSKTVLSMYKERLGGNDGTLMTSLHKLDTTLRGGLSTGTITEITGPPGCGKTQFCIMLSVVAALPRSLGGKGSPIVYIDTEAAFTAERLVEMAKARYVTHFASVKNLVDLAAKVHIFRELTCDAFLKRLEMLDEIIASQGIGLIIVDSIASLVRKEFDTSSGKGVADRAALLAKQAARLKYLAEAYQLPVVVTNQITTHVSDDQKKKSDWSDKDEDQSSDRSEGIVTAALGTSWSHCINTRLMLEYAKGTKRVLTVTKSPVSGWERFVVSIEDKGLVLDWLATAELEDMPSVDPMAVSLKVKSTAGGLGAELRIS